MPTTVFELKPSLCYITLLSVVSLASLLIVLLVALPLWIKIPLFIFVLVYLGWILWRDGLLKASSSVLRLTLLEDKNWLIETRAGQFKAVLRGDSTVTGYISALRFSIPGKRRVLSCVVVKDSLLASQYKALLRVIH